MGEKAVRLLTYDVQSFFPEWPLHQDQGPSPTVMVGQKYKEQS